MVARVEETVRERARTIVDAVAPRGECDFVTDIAAALPLEIICEMMGIPPSDYRRIFELTNIILGVGDPEYATHHRGAHGGGHGALRSSRRTSASARLEHADATTSPRR